METSIRRYNIMKLLCRRRHETITNLAAEFGVSERTIRRDIEILSLSEPIYTQAGRHYGGVYVTENYNFDRMYFKKSELEVMHKILSCQENDSKCVLSSDEKSTLRKLVKEYTKPTIAKKKSELNCL